MTDERTAPRSRLGFAAIAILLLLVGAGAGWLWQTRGKDAASIAVADRAAVEDVVREYILSHPEILPQAMQNLQRRENAQLLKSVRGDLETPFPGAVMGNPKGAVTLVMFTDYACGYCRQSVPEVNALIAANPDLRVVVRELPIIAPASEDAARWALAAAAQGRYFAFHQAIFAAGQPNTTAIDAAARTAGLDIERARNDSADSKVDQEIARNIDFARKLGVTGTPSWIIGDQMLFGAVGRDDLGKAIAEARSQPS